jgi:hypothetical protein
MKPPQPNVTIITHNLWLIPFGGAFFLGRSRLCASSLAASTESAIKNNQADSLVVVCVQEVRSGKGQAAPWISPHWKY